MRNWKDIILPEYEIRKTREQKTRFIEMLKKEYGERMRVEESTKSDKSRNIVFGDPEKAKKVFTAHYDTCVFMPFPNFITPMNIAVYVIYQILIVVMVYLPAVLLMLLASYLTTGLSDLVRVIINEVIIFGSLFGLIFYLRKGPANRHTANDNTSGVVTVLTLLDKLGTDTGCAFILFDNEESGLKGSKAYVTAHPGMKNKGFIINLDCVSDGDYILLYSSKDVKDSSECKCISDRAAEIFPRYGKTPLIPKKFAFYPSDQIAFKRNIAVAALKRSKLLGYYMDKIHTHRDVEFDEDNIAALVELFSDIECGNTEK